MAKKTFICVSSPKPTRLDVTMNTQTQNVEWPCILRKRVNRLKTSRDDLKSKNQEKSCKIKKLNDKVFDIKESRDKWRNAYKKEAVESQRLRKYVQDVEAQLEQERQLVCQLRIEAEDLKKKSDDVKALLPEDGPSPCHCWYPILIVLMSLKMVLRAAISLRGAPKAIHIVFSSYTALMKKKIPSYKTVRRWISRLGHYKLHCPLEQSDDWALIVDASIQTGENKCLMVLGIRLSQLKKGKTLSFEDYTPLVLEMHKQCNAKTVDAALRKAQSRAGKIQMICADGGSDIVAGIKLYQKDHPEVAYIYDITHKVAIFVKHELEDDERWIRFCKMAAQTKNRVQQTGLAHLAPPNQRSKCRFMNMEALIGWGKKMLHFMEKKSGEEELGHDLKTINEHFGWLHDFSDLLKTCGDILEVCQIARHFVRTNMIDRTVVIGLTALLEPLPLCERARQLAGKILDFLTECTEKVPIGTLWIGTSEIIESLFGKLKNIEHDQNSSGFTSLVLSAAACIGRIDVQTISMALNNSKDKDIIVWEAENLGTTMQAKRKQILNNKDIVARKAKNLEIDAQAKRKQNLINSEQKPTGFLKGTFRVAS